MTSIPQDGRDILDAPEFATIATLMADGQPQLSVVWIERDGDDVLVSTIKGRQKYRNIERDPRVSVLAFPKESPYAYVEIRGTATMVEEGGRELIDRLCLAYTGADRYTGDERTDNVRVVVRIRPDRVIIR
jgi:PPOX class probable F420-dependent enzyme